MRLASCGVGVGDRCSCIAYSSGTAPTSITLLSHPITPYHTLSHSHTLTTPYHTLTHYHTLITSITCITCITLCHTLSHYYPLTLSHPITPYHTLLHSYHTLSHPITLSLYYTISHSITLDHTFVGPMLESSLFFDHFFLYTVVHTTV